MSHSFADAVLLAQAGGQTHADSWALVLFCTILGVSIALLPPRRTSEIKRAKDE